MRGEKSNPIMNEWIRKYINERFFKHTPDDMKQFENYHRLFGVFISMNALGLNVHSGIGNLTQGQVQTLLISPSVWKTAWSRIGQLSKVINIMHNNHVGMLLEDIQFKQGSRALEWIAQKGFIITEKVEDINQALAFLGSMTDKELSMYDSQGNVIDPNNQMSVYRVHQMESLVREINGDYGHNRPLYSSNPYLMELGRFKFGWWQTMINTHFGSSYIDPWGMEHASIAESTIKVLQRTFLQLMRFVSPSSRLAMIANVLGKQNEQVLMAQLSDTVEEAQNKAISGTADETILNTKVFKLDVNGTPKYFAITPNSQMSMYARMALEFLAETNKRDFQKMNRVDRANFARFRNELMMGASYGIAMTLIGSILLAIGSGYGNPEKDPDYDGQVKLWDALVFGLKYSWIAKIIASLPGGEPVVPPEPLKNFSSLTDSEWRTKKILEAMYSYMKQSNSDVMIPIDPTQYASWLDMTKIAGIGSVSSLFQLTGSAFTDLFHGELTKFGNTSIKYGYNAQTAKTPYYLMNVLPMRSVFKTLYDFGYMQKSDLETAQVYSEALSQFKEYFKTFYGYENKKVDFSSPEDKEKWDEIVAKVAATYYSPKERETKIAKRPIYKIKGVGLQNISNEANKFNVSYDNIKKYKK
jgi:hypothetical protein